MSIYQCSKCGCAENTALSEGARGPVWNPESATKRNLDPKGRYCSFCWDGAWHGRFERKFYPIGTMETNRDGNLQEKK